MTEEDEAEERLEGETRKGQEVGPDQGKQPMSVMIAVSLTIILQTSVCNTDEWP